MTSYRPWRPSQGEIKLSQMRHATLPGYGDGSADLLPLILDAVAGTGAGSVLDYGCGKGGMVNALRGAGIATQGYDPAIPAWHREPAAADLVISLFVLDVVEDHRIEAVLDRMFHLARIAVWSWVTVRSPLGRKVPPATQWLDGFSRRGVLAGADVVDGVLQVMAMTEKTDLSRADDRIRVG